MNTKTPREWLKARHEGAARGLDVARSAALRELEPAHGEPVHRVPTSEETSPTFWLGFLGFAALVAFGLWRSPSQGSGNPGVPSVVAPGSPVMGAAAGGDGQAAAAVPGVSSPAREGREVPLLPERATTASAPRDRIVLQGAAAQYAIEEELARLRGAGERDGRLDLQLAHSYYAEGRFAEAREAAKTALRKGIPEREGQAWMFVAVSAYFLEDWQDAQNSLTKAAAAKDSPDPNQAKNLMDAINEQLKLTQREQELRGTAAAPPPVSNREARVEGAVNKPGAVAFGEAASLPIETVLERAGGVTALANLAELSVLRRRPDGSTETIRIPLADVNGPSSSASRVKFAPFVVLPGDVVRVGMRFF